MKYARGWAFFIFILAVSSSTAFAKNSCVLQSLEEIISRDIDHQLNSRFARVQLYDGTSSTEIQGKLLSLFKSEDYQIFTIEDNSGNLHFFDSDYLKKVNEISEHALKDNKKETSPTVMVDKEKFRKTICKQHVQFTKLIKFKPFRKLVDNNFRTRGTKPFRDLMLKRCGINTAGIGAVYVPWEISLIARLSLPNKDWGMLQHASNYYMIIPLMGALDHCLKAMNPHNRLATLGAAVGGAEAVNLFSETLANGAITTNERIDMKDFAAGNLGILTYLIASSMFENDYKVAMSEVCS